MRITAESVGWHDIVAGCCSDQQAALGRLSIESSICRSDPGRNISFLEDRCLYIAKRCASIHLILQRAVAMDDFEARRPVRKIASGVPHTLRRELQREWRGYQDACEYLRERGYVFAGDHWIAPPNPARKDVRAIVFLHLEWDYPQFVAPSPEMMPPLGRHH
jgi:hypothetical protein